MIWDDEFDDKNVLLNYPSFDRTEKLLLTEPNSKWFDNSQHTGKRNLCRYCDAVHLLQRLMNWSTNMANRAKNGNGEM